MEELISVAAGELCISRRGNASGPPIIHLEGHRAQHISFPDAYLDLLVEAGAHVVSVDNRDVGRSFRAEADYRLADMAEDVHELICQLGPPAIVTGRSMGGAIAQLLALAHPGDVAGLGLFYTYASDRRREPRPAAPAPFHDRAQFIDYELGALPEIAGSRYPCAAPDIEALAGRMWARGVSWAGWERQRRAMEASEPWAHRLAEIVVPTVVVHGAEDPVIAPAEGSRLARAIAPATFRLIEGMGHQQPPELSELFAELTLDLLRY
ncbi:MAG: alpha/beta hydrolase [Flaviflexus sp.]|nr:alpha/beta hydrolase [Flaviflexus sp.]